MKPSPHRLRDELTALTTRTRVTTLLVTHDLAEAIQLADRLFFLSDRPARVMLEKSLPPPRGARSRETIASIGDECGRCWRPDMEALEFGCFDRVFSREPVPTSLENAKALHQPALDREAHEFGGRAQAELLPDDRRGIGDRLVG